MSHDPEGNQRILRQLLCDLPPRRAPATLESRVLVELERRAALSWWRRGFAHWPLAARALFVATCGALIGVSLAWAPQGTVAAWLSWSQPAFVAMSSVGALGARVAHWIPDGWLYGMAAAMAALYASLFGLGTAAYRILYRQPSSAGHPL